MKVRADVFLQAAAVLAVAASFAILGTRVAAGPGLPFLPLGLVLGLILADALSGLVHWAGDTFLAEDTPLLGALFIAPFRDHHRDPLGITRHSVLARNGNNAIALLPLLAWAVLDPQPAPLEALLLCTCAVLMLSNELHAYAHRSERPALVRWLQGRGVILSPEHHARHHAAPHRGSYCVTTGWCNAPLDHLQLFARAERIVRRLTRLPASR